MKIIKTWFKKEIEITPQELTNFMNLDMDMHSKIYIDICAIIRRLEKRF